MQLEWPYLDTRRRRGGKIAYYVRRKGRPLIRLPDNPKSPEFAAAYEQALAVAAAGPVRRDVGSFAWLCDRYMDSAEFTTKKPATQAARRRIIRAMCSEPLDPAHPETFGQESISVFTARHIQVLRDRKAASPFAANERLKVLSQIFKCRAAQEFFEISPTHGAERLKTPSGGHRTATDADIAAYEARHPSGPPALAMALLRATGVRVSDLRILGRRNLQDGLLVFETVKTGVLCELPIAPELQAALPDRETFLLSDNGKPYASDKSLSNRVAKWFRQAGVENTTAHSVRKWLATRMADRGATEYGLMAWFGWRDAKEARPYVEKANRRQGAARAGAAVHSIR